MYKTFVNLPYYKMPLLLGLFICQYYNFIFKDFKAKKKTRVFLKSISL